MKFVLMMHAPRGTGDWEIFKWAKRDIDAHMAHFGKLNAELEEKGELVSIQGLTPPKQARLVRAKRDGSPEVTDGPFAESKEFLAGWWIIDVKNAERAYEIAARASTAPGPGGEPLHMTIEVREVMGDPTDR